MPRSKGQMLPACSIVKLAYTPAGSLVDSGEGKPIPLSVAIIILFVLTAGNSGLNYGSFVGVF